MSKFLLLLTTLFTLHLNAPASAEVLWDNWYTVSESDIPDMIYNEKVELLGDRAKIQVNTRYAPKPERIIVSENLGATAKNTPLLEPMLFNYRTTDSLGKTSVTDGSIIENGKVFSVKTSSGAASAKPMRAQMLPKLILASFFPVWVHKNYKRITGVQPIEFQAILEDHVTQEVPVVKGTAYEMNPDEFSKKTSTRKIRIVFGDTVAIWYVAKSGEAVQIEVQSLKKIVKKVDKATAEKFIAL